MSVFPNITLLTSECLIHTSEMLPSVDPLHFKLYLGYMDYPTDSSYVAMTEMPLEGAAAGDESFGSFLEFSRGR